jgi:carboxyl-terminal processing protease
LISAGTLSEIKPRWQLLLRFGGPNQRHAQNVFNPEQIQLHWVEIVPRAMRHLKIKTRAAGALAALVGAAIVAGCAAPRTVPSPPPPVAQTNVPLAPGPNDARIAYWTVRLLEDFHYSQQPLDTEMSEKFFDGYLETLDPRHENFLQSDLAEFARYRTNLDMLTVGGHDAADLTPAYEIFRRFLERLRQHAAYADELLRRDRFELNSDERILLDRRHAPYPKDLDEAKQLWRQRLRFEYLQEKLSREISLTNFPATLALPKPATDEIINTLTRHNNWTLRMSTNWDSDNVLQAYLTALAHAYDPHSDYLSPPHAQDFSIDMSLSLYGIGAQLAEDDGYCTIRALTPGGPADKSKQIKEKDRIIAVAQSNQPPVNVVDMELLKVVQLIRGPKGTQVRLTISPAEDRAARRLVTLVRDEIKLEDHEAKAWLIELPVDHGGTTRLGVINLPSFYTPLDLSGNTGHSAPKFTSVDVAKLIKKLEREKVAGIILDLRRNPGGSLEEAVKLTGLFIKDGPVVLARSPNGKVTLEADTDASVLYAGPLVVLVNRLSASASEIAAAALQDYGRALIVGDSSTHGKGTVQNLNPLRPFVWPATRSATNDPGTVKITIRKFYRVSGASTQLKGVTPDIVLPDVLNYSTDIGESSLDNPLPWDVIPSANYHALGLVQPYLAELRRRSDARIATNQDFIYIEQDIDEFRRLQADQTASLNEREQLEQRQESEARQKARDQERASRKAPDMKIYELTVENADQPGLPPPLGSSNTVAAARNEAVSPAEKLKQLMSEKADLRRKIADPIALHAEMKKMNEQIAVTRRWAWIQQGVYANSQKKGAQLLAEHASASATLTAPQTVSAAGGGSQPTPQPPSLDPTLDETVHILKDYVSLLSTNPATVASQ